MAFIKKIMILTCLLAFSPQVSASKDLLICSSAATVVSLGSYYAYGLKHGYSLKQLSQGLIFSKTLKKVAKESGKTSRQQRKIRTNLNNMGMTSLWLGVFACSTGVSIVAGKVQDELDRRAVEKMRREAAEIPDSVVSPSDKRVIEQQGYSLNGSVDCPICFEGFSNDRKVYFCTADRQIGDGGEITFSGHPVCGVCLPLLNGICPSTRQDSGFTRVL